MASHWLQWAVALLIVVALLTIGAAVHEYLIWQKDRE